VSESGRRLVLLKPARARGVFNLLGGTLGTALGLLVVGTALDLHIAGSSPDAFLSAFLAEGLESALDPLGEVLAAVLGISLTVVAIVVQLAAQRYPAKIVDLFMYDRLNIVTFAFMASSCIFVVVAPAIASTGSHPWVAGLAVVLAITNFSILLPYFGHVFSFLEPTNIISEIELRLRNHLERARTHDDIEASQRVVAAGVDRIADNCMAAVAQSDRNLAIHSVVTLEDILTKYVREKRTFPKAWMQVDWNFSGTLAQEFADEIIERGTWLEAKALMEFERILRRALEEMNEVVSQLSRSTRIVGETALEAKEFETVELCIRFFNTFVRHGLNRRNVRAVYNVLYEYRRFALSLIGHRPEDTIRIVEYLVYYGRTATDMGLPFVTVTVAHDVRVICEAAHRDATLDLKKVLDLFLKLDQPVDGKAHEVALIGVRKAQSILGAYLLKEGLNDLANTIREDMANDDQERLKDAWDEILAIRDRKFWEITDRGLNFDYVDDDLRPWISKFFQPLIKTGTPPVTPSV